VKYSVCSESVNQHFNEKSSLLHLRFSWRWIYFIHSLFSDTFSVTQTI